MEMRKHELFDENEPNEMLLSCHEACCVSLWRKCLNYLFRFNGAVSRGYICTVLGQFCA